MRNNYRAWAYCPCTGCRRIRAANHLLNKGRVSKAGTLSFLFWRCIMMFARDPPRTKRTRKQKTHTKGEQKMHKLKSKIKIVKDTCHEKVEAIGDKIEDFIYEYEEEATKFVTAGIVVVFVVEAAYIHGIARGYMRVIKKRGY